MYYLFLTLAVLVVVSTITVGVIKLYKGEVAGKSKVKKAIRVNLFSMLPVFAGLVMTAIPQAAYAAGTGDSASGLAYIAAGLSTGLAALGAGFAVGSVGSSAIGAISEDPKILGKTLIMIGLAEGIAIYGLIISLMIISKIG